MSKKNNRDWRVYRQDEGNGFVSSRIIVDLLARQMWMYGSSFYINHGKIKQVLHPWDVMIDRTVIPPGAEV